MNRLDGADDVLGELVGLLERKLGPQGGFRQKVYLAVSCRKTMSSGTIRK